MPLSPMIIPLAGIALPIIIVPTALFAKHVGQQRHHRHMERMQAMKSGVAPPASVPLPGPGAVVAIGAGVPTACMLAALGATLSLPFHTPDLVPLLGIIWCAAVFLGICGLTSGLILGLLLHRANAKIAAAARDASAKPAYDPDMFDAAHRGY